MNCPIQHWTFSVDDYHRMLETGILGEDDRVELLQGEIVRKFPISRLHAACVSRINELFHDLLGKSATIQVQNPVQLNDSSEPEPDVTVLKRRDDFYAESLPMPADVLLLIEVADSSIDVDREVKLPLYAKAGVAEIWIVNLNEDQIESHSQPIGDVYQNVRFLCRGESLSPVNFPQLSIRVEDVIG